MVYFHDSFSSAIFKYLFDAFTKKLHFFYTFSSRGGDAHSLPKHTYLGNNNVLFCAQLAGTNINALTSKLNFLGWLYDLCEGRIYIC